MAVVPGASARGVWAVVVAAGRGVRFGGPKQYELAAGHPVLDWSVAAARAACEGIVVVVAPEHLADGPLPGGVDVVVPGGATRSASVRAGLAVVPADATVVLVHDAARPCASPGLFASVVAAVRAGADAALPAVPLTDSIRTVAGRPVDRTELLAVQTPQGFAPDVLRAVHAGEPEATDDASLVDAAGATVVTVPGEPDNRKITTAADLVLADAVLAGSERSRGLDVRVGLGFDVHPHTDDDERVLVLGGVAFPGARALAGHSDADVVAHACADALLGAAGLGDIGEHYPDTDPAWAGADSVTLLTDVAAKVRAAGWEPGNIDASVVLDDPQLAPHRAEMQQRLSAAAGAEVTVKGRRPEGLGALGRGEGVACWAVAVVGRGSAT
ncbi:bifunctional 2-C-methyl-D-erythritol 4-phosphate cytidylyltransferase/2-C-methyl-D-erythritol 2,4-cyclodiphosphate synthase [soil metagenome]